MNNLKCPKCSAQVMSLDNIDGVQIHSCEKCKGIWLNKGELNIVVHPIEGDLEYCSTDNLKEDMISDYACPQCEELMSKVNFISYSDIILDYCRKCKGIWLNKGELDAINAEIDQLKHEPESWDHKIMVFLSKLPF